MHISHGLATVATLKSNVDKGLDEDFGDDASRLAIQQ